MFGEFNKDRVTLFEYDCTVANSPGSKFDVVNDGNFLGITNLLARPSAVSYTHLRAHET